jgi:exodeoxyribonuclease VII small subunit
MDQPLPPTYEDSLRELQSLVQSLEQGEVPIDALPERLDRAQHLLAHCREKLKNIGENLRGEDQ